MKKHRVLGIGVVMIVSLVLLTMLGGCASWFRGGETIPIAETKSLSPIDAQVEKTESQSVVKLGPVGSLDFQLGKTDRYALVVGNGAYEKTTKLANPVNDASDVADKLSDLGFKVRLETNTTLSRMEGAVREFSKEARDAKASTALFFYAGHGVQYEGINYLLPVDADIQRDYELRSKALSMDMVTSALEDTKSGFNLVILDACRDNPFASGRGGSRGLGVMGGGTAESMVVFATAPGSVAQDGDGRNSPFTAALKQHLATPDLEVRQLVAAVSRSVQDMTRGMQIPWVNTSFTGQFFFLTAQQQLAKAESDAKQLQGELAALEAEIAKRQAAISAETDTYARQQLQLEQQRAKALENSKKLEVQRMEQLREQAAYQLAVQEKELAEKRALEATVAGQQEELARQAHIRRAELAELDRKKSLSSDALQRLDLIAKMEKAVSDIQESFALSIAGTREELERLGLQRISSYKTANPQDPWETIKEFEARVGEYQAALITEGEAKIREIERQSDAEVGKIQVQLEQAKRELEGMRFTLGPTMTKVTVDKFDAENKRFPIKVSSLDDSLPFDVSLFFKIDSTDRNVLQREYKRMDDAQKVNALVGTIHYSMEELSPSIWVCKVESTSILSLLEEVSGDPVELIRSNPNTIVKSREVLYGIEKGMISQKLSYQIRSIGPAGGSIFYDKGNYSDGWRYLEAAPTGWSGGSEDPGKVWGGYGTAVVGGRGTGIGTGASNTQKIVAQFGNAEPYEKKADYAAKVCADYQGGGYADWFLPSKDELKLMYQNLKKNNLGGFSDWHYWSSSESDDGYYVWAQYFYNGGQGYNLRNYGYRVRPVRAF